MWFRGDRVELLTGPDKGKQGYINYIVQVSQTQLRTIRFGQRQVLNRIIFAGEELGDSGGFKCGV